MIRAHDAVVEIVSVDGVEVFPPTIDVAPAQRAYQTAGGTFFLVVQREFVSRPVVVHLAQYTLGMSFHSGEVYVAIVAVFQFILQCKVFGTVQRAVVIDACRAIPVAFHILRFVGVNARRRVEGEAIGDGVLLHIERKIQGWPLVSPVVLVSNVNHGKVGRGVFEVWVAQRDGQGVGVVAPIDFRIQIRHVGSHVSVSPDAVLIVGGAHIQIGCCFPCLLTDVGVEGRTPVIQTLPFVLNGDAETNIK